MRRSPITNEETGVTLDAKTNDAGEYTYSTLNAGHYSVTITAKGFEKVLQQHIPGGCGVHV